ncbi:hypothetical protein Hdeb2414_s0006g00203531 [Helianthus debilis subsp. tardiflorus]
MYAKWGVAVDDNQKLAKGRYWLITEGFRSFLTVVSQSKEFKGSLERIYRAYRNVGYQAGLKDGEERDSSLQFKGQEATVQTDKEFRENTPALLKRILERPLMSIDELKVLLTPAGPSSPKSLSGDASQ